MKPTSYGLIGFMNRVIEQDCADPRNRVYGLLGILDLDLHDQARSKSDNV
jgi:hypothetical protein